MNILKVNLWGKEIGRLSFKPDERSIIFVFNPELKDKRPDLAPFLAPLAQWESYPFVYGDDRRIYQGLPPFIADSLPDSWGNMLFEQWAKKNRLSRRNISPLLKLMFIGRRGMGALEFEPAAEDLEYTKGVDIAALYDLSLKVLDERADVLIRPDDELTLQGLFAVGSSAGGRQMKAVIAIDPSTGEIRSGQIDGLSSSDYFLLKFEGSELPSTEIELSFYEMATSAGIEMAECRTLEISGVKHLLSRRFDRKDGRKIHMQTLAAINPEADSYEDLLATCRSLKLSDADIEQVFVRMVFNVMANNTDDHNKNFSFLLEECGRWRLAPAYDQTFIFNRFGTDGETDRCLCIGGKTRDISRDDIIDFAREYGFNNPEKVMDRIAGALSSFSSIAEKNAIPPRWRTIIENTLVRNLQRFGYLPATDDDEILSAPDGRTFSNVSVKINRRGIYEVTAMVDGRPMRRFVRKNMELFHLFESNEFGRADNEYRAFILSRLFD